MKKTLFIFLVSCNFLLINICYSQWVQVSNGMGNIIAGALTADGTNMFAGGTSAGVYYTSNSGANWVQTTLNNQLVFALINSGSNVLAGTFNAGTFRSTNNGAAWSQITMGSNMTVWAYCYSGSNVFAGTFCPVVANMGVYKSTDNGLTWSLAGANNREVRSITSEGNYIYAGTIDSGVFISSNSGTNWFKSSLNNRNVRSIAANGSSVYAGILNSQGLFMSTNNGNTWVQSSLNNRDCQALAIQGSTILTGTAAFGVYVSNDNGTNWVQKNEGLGHLSVFALIIQNGYVYAGTSGGGVYRRAISELLAIQLISNQVPSRFSLSQNYPNPFNPSTNIIFQLPRANRVKLSVYDLVGREVEVLVNEELKAGEYEVDFNAANYPSGVYYYKLSAGDFNETKKMVLLK
jgi:hypothetical protein